MYGGWILSDHSLLAVGVCPASKGVVFKDILVTNRVSILVILVSNWVWFLHSSLELIAMFSVF